MKDMLGTPIRPGDIAVTAVSSRSSGPPRVGVITKVAPSGSVNIKTATIRWGGKVSRGGLNRSSTQVVVVRWRDMKDEDNELYKALKEIREEMMKK